MPLIWVLLSLGILACVLAYRALEITPLATEKDQA
jgi:hypothetical protein